MIDPNFKVVGEVCTVDRVDPPYEQETTYAFSTALKIRIEPGVTVEQCVDLGKRLRAVAEAEYRRWLAEVEGPRS